MPRILIIDDDPDVRTLESKILKQEGYEVTEASDGVSGTRLFREILHDLVITDIIMPEREGIEVMTELKKDYPNIKIIAVSGGGAFVSGERCLQLARRLGACRTIAKPFRKKEFLDAVRDVLRG
jgi:CheY-like chemotaxis protein